MRVSIRHLDTMSGTATIDLASIGTANADRDARRFNFRRAPSGSR
jgi:polyisoprenoid-binding protein YceI